MAARWIRPGLGRHLTDMAVPLTGVDKREPAGHEVCSLVTCTALHAIVSNVFSYPRHSTRAVRSKGQPSSRQDAFHAFSFQSNTRGSDPFHSLSLDSIHIYIYIYIITYITRRDASWCGTTFALHRAAQRCGVALCCIALPRIASHRVTSQTACKDVSETSGTRPREAPF